MEIGITKLYKIEDFPHVATLLRGKTELIVYFLLFYTCKNIVNISHTSNSALKSMLSFDPVL